MSKRVIVISAVNIIDGGALTVLRDCIAHLSQKIYSDFYRVVCLTNSRDLFPKTDTIEFIEYPKSKLHYYYRLYYEYWAFKKISRKLHPYLWLSLHDTSPRVEAEVQAVYMHNPTPFYKPGWKDWRYVPMNAIWAYLYEYLYKINIHSNTYLVVQQNWLRDAFSSMFDFKESRIIVSRPYSEKQKPISYEWQDEHRPYTFFYPAYPRVFKNYECICEAAILLESKYKGRVKIVLTVDGTENSYSRDLVKNYSNVSIIDFVGLIKQSDMLSYYSMTDCLLFPSKLETWGLPISEFKPYERPMIIADLPYARETASGAKMVAFFNPNSPADLAKYIDNAVKSEFSSFKYVPVVKSQAPCSESWGELFDILLRKK